jgi:hypothetical protein
MLPRVEMGNSKLTTRRILYTTYFLPPMPGLILLVPVVLAVLVLLGLKRWTSPGVGVRKKMSTLRSLGLPNPDPLFKFDLETATTRNVRRRLKSLFYNSSSRSSSMFMLTRFFAILISK